MVAILQKDIGSGSFVDENSYILIWQVIIQ